MGRRTRTTFGYLLAVALSILIFVLLYQGWRADLDLPANPLKLDFAMLTATIFKGMVDNPWCSFNRYLGAPTGLDLRDYPMPDLFFLLWAKGATFFTKNPFRIANLTLILSFPLVTVPTLFVLRRLGIRYSIALVASLLFAFLPYHHMRGLAHVWVTLGYCTVPLATLVALDIFGGNPVLFEEGSTLRRPRWALRSARSKIAIAVALVIGLSGAVYYPFFSSFFIFVAGAFGAIRRRSALPFVRAIAVLSIVGGALALNVAPSAIYFFEHGKTSALDRNPEASELYGLKITQLLFPMTTHRVPGFRRLREIYDLTAPFVTEKRGAATPILNENSTLYLGLIGAVGFLYLLVTLMNGSRATAAVASSSSAEDPEVMQGLRVLNLAGLLLGTTGGFGALFAYLVSPQIRSYNRVAVYIAFFALLALAILVERAASKSERPWRGVPILPMALAAALAFGLLDQFPLGVSFSNAFDREFFEDDHFVHDIEASIPPESSVFQLPFVPFPENGSVEKLDDYGLLVPYLHSKTIHWSYPSMRGRRGDRWNSDLAARPVPEMVDALAEAGFAGIYVSRDAYADHGIDLEARLASALGVSALVSPRGDATFFPLAHRAETLRADLGEPAFRQKGEDVRTPVFWGWLEGYYPVETEGDRSWVWSRANARFVLANPGKVTRTVILDSLVKAANGPATIHIDGDLFHEEIHTDSAGAHLVKTIDVPPGEHIFRVSTDGRRSSAPDPRDLYILMNNPHIIPVTHRASASNESL